MNSLAYASKFVIKPKRIIRDVHVVASSKERPLGAQGEGVASLTEGEPPDGELEKKAAEMAEALISDRIGQIEAASREQCERAHRSGFEEGKDLGLQIERKEIQPVLESLRGILKEISAERDRLIRDAESTVLRLALAVARKIVRAEIRQHPDLILNIVREAIKHVSDRSGLVVRVHPDDGRNVEGFRDQLLSSLNGIQTLEIEQDSQVAPGGCIVETNTGIIDAQLDVQLEELERALLDENRVRSDSK